MWILFDLRFSIFTFTLYTLYNYNNQYKYKYKYNSIKMQFVKQNDLNTKYNLNKIIINNFSLLSFCFRLPFISFRLLFVWTDDAPLASRQRETERSGRGCVHVNCPICSNIYYICMCMCWCMCTHAPCKYLRYLNMTCCTL